MAESAGPDCRREEGQVLARPKPREAAEMAVSAAGLRPVAAGNAAAAATAAPASAEGAAAAAAAFAGPAAAGDLDCIYFRCSCC